MKKLLSLLSVITITGTSAPTVIAASPYQNEITNILNNDLENIKNDNTQVEIYTGDHEDGVIFTRNDYDFKWLPYWGTQWLIKINKSGMIKILEWIKRNPNKAKYAGSLMAAIIGGGLASFAADYLALVGYSWPTTTIYFTQMLSGLASGFISYKILGSKMVKSMIDVIKNPNLHFTAEAAWVAMTSYKIDKTKFGTVINGQTQPITVVDDYHTYDTDDIDGANNVHLLIT